MMHFYGALILLVTVSAACGLRCYTCVGEHCTDTMTCPTNFDRCASVNMNGLFTKSCMSSIYVLAPLKCCSTDLCNSAIPTGPSVLLLLVSSAIISLFSLRQRSSNSLTISVFFHTQFQQLKKIKLILNM
ncbi:three-finger toxin MALT0070C-like [Anoplopoma fimbria]|uniref:three-finger toxin MALT0070C-like n=1 Tax=Anoplopoma fimbria TaxID=229290 RepID=UPI0023EDF014|nr:three-finger toxin MALT0070C-like [Anoplopoma fimbria]